MTVLMSNPNTPRPTPDNPNPEPRHPPTPPETPNPNETPAVPPPAPDTVPLPGQEPVQIPPDTPPEVPPPSGFPARAAFLAAVLGCIAVAGPTVAQTSEGDRNATKPAGPCQAQPENPAEPEGDDTRGQEHQAGHGQRPGLEDCDGVLVPPKTGDREIEEPPPDTGTTPVIPPETVPEQPPD